jgi:hypothetical protein
MTDQIDINNNASSDDDGALWVSISELASLKGVTKQSISERVARLETSRLLATRKGSANTKLVNLAEYDRAVGETTDLAKQQAAVTMRATRTDSAAENDAGAASADPTYVEAQRRKTHYEADLKALELGERMGSLVAINKVETVIAEIAEEIARPINQLPLRADEIAAAASRDGPAGVRAVLKDAAFNLLRAIAHALRRLDLNGKNAAADGVEVDIVAPDDGRPS